MEENTQILENLKIEGYKDKYYIPSVDFNVVTGVCELSGESFLESTVKFYEPLIDWIKKYIEIEKRPITFNVRLTYYNTSSSKRIFDILRILKDYENNGGMVTINWYLEEEEIDVIDEIEDYKIVTKLKINIIIQDE